MTDRVNPIRLSDLVEELLELARLAHSGRAARGVYGGSHLRQAMLTLVSGAELSEHEAPPEATLQVIRGRLTLSTAEESWDLGAGEFVMIPSQRHSVTAIEDSAFLLTIRTDIAER